MDEGMMNYFKNYRTNESEEVISTCCIELPFEVKQEF